MAQPGTTQIRKPGLIRPWIGDPPPDHPPELDGYRQLAHERFDMVRGSIAGMALIPFWFILLSVSIAASGGRYIDEAVIDVMSLLVGVFVALVAVPLIHEVFHGLAALLVGVRPSFGIGPGFAYTTVKEPLSKRAYLLIALAPIVAISAIGIPLAAAWNAATGFILFALVVNAGGAIGDLWMSWRAALQPSDARFIDLADGFAIFVPETPALDHEGVSTL